MRRPRGVANARAIGTAALRAIARFTVAAEPVAYGGQALVDGVLMRGRTHVGVALRAKDGSIATATEALGGGALRRLLAKIPASRGVVVLWETLALGSRWLLRSAEVSASANQMSPAASVAKPEVCANHEDGAAETDKGHSQA